MTQDDRLDPRLAELLGEIAPARAPDRLRRDVLTSIDRVQPRSRWLALIKETPMRRASHVAVGSPTLRFTTLVVFTVLLATLAIGGAVAGTSLLSGPVPVPSPVPTVAACADVVCPGAPLAEGRSGHSATRLDDGTVLVIGGGTEFWSVFPLAAERWDPVSEMFRPAGSLAEGRHSHTATLLLDGRVLVTGGYAAVDGNDDVTLASAEVWDPRTQTFIPTGPMAVSRGAHAAACCPMAV